MVCFAERTARCEFRRTCRATVSASSISDSCGTTFETRFHSSACRGGRRRGRWRAGGARGRGGGGRVGAAPAGGRERPAPPARGGAGGARGRAAGARAAAGGAAPRGAQASHKRKKTSAPYSNNK